MIDFNMEEWIDIEGFDGDYQISNYGRVKSFKNKCRLIGVNNKPNGAGYKDIQLSKSGKVTHHRIHRLVATHFHQKIDDNVVNHIDGDKLNNTDVNLEWITASENHKHALEIGLRKRGGDLSFSKSVTQFDMDGNMIKKFPSVVEAGSELKICRHNIAACCRGVLYSSHGFRWSFTDKLNDRLILNCIHCNKKYEATRSNKKYCSASCRGSYNKKLKVITGEKPMKKMN
jgi:hypothetical protein